MKLGLVRVSLLTAATVMLVGCAVDASLKETSLKIIRDGAKSGPVDYYDRASTIGINGEPNQLRYEDVGGNSKLILANLVTGSQIDIGKDSPPNAKLSFAIIRSDGANVYVLWRPKLASDIAGVGAAGDKFIYMKTSNDGGKTFGGPKVLNNSNGAFMPQIATSSMRNVYVAWVDEREGAKFDIYLNSSNDGGMSWLKEDMRMDSGEHSISSINPTLVADGQNAWLGWMDGDRDISLYVRSTSDAGKTWTSRVTALESKQAPIKPTLLRIKGQLLYYWYTAEGLQGVRSRDDGKSWEKMLVVPDTRGMIDMAIASDSAGRIHVAIGRKGEKQEDDKENIFYAYSDDGIIFSPQQKLSSSPAFKSTATLPEIAVNDAGQVVVVWQDHKYLRANVNANVSGDSGKTWLGQDLSLSDRTGSNFGIYPSITSLGAKMAVTWTEYDNSTLTTGRTASRIIDPSLPIVEAPILPVDIGKLKTQVEGYWNSRIKSDWAESYSYMDPYFRDTSTKAEYVKGQGIFTYYAYKPINQMVDGRRAKVTLKYTFELPATMLAGKKIVVPRTEEEIIQDWIWIDNNWYLINKNMMGHDNIVF
jgi:hypothetical protein